MNETERATRFRVTYEQLEKFEAAIVVALASEPAEGVHPDIHKVEIDAMRAVAGDLRKEAEELAGGNRYVCTKENPWVEGVAVLSSHQRGVVSAKRAVHPAATSRECHEGCCDHYTCPYCDTRWTVEHDG